VPSYKRLAASVETEKSFPSKIKANGNDGSGRAYYVHLFTHLLPSNLLFDQRRNAYSVTGNNFYRIKTNVFLLRRSNNIFYFFSFHLCCLSDRTGAQQKRRHTHSHIYCIYLYVGEGLSVVLAVVLVTTSMYNCNGWRGNKHRHRYVSSYFILCRQNSRQILYVEVDKFHFGRCSTLSR